MKNINLRDVDILNGCVLCGGSSFELLEIPGTWIGLEIFGNLNRRIGLMRCRGCGLKFVNPRPSGEYLNKFYSGDTYSCHEVEGSSSDEGKADFLLDRIERHLPIGLPRTLLDYGAGGGGFMRHARTRGWVVSGFEPGRQGLVNCRASGLDVTSRLEDQPSGHFSLVTLHHVLEHIQDPVCVLGDIHRLLVPGGCLFIEVPNVYSLRARLAVPALSKRFPIDERYRAFPIHLFYYEAKTLRKMLEKTGWKVESMFTVGIGLDALYIPPKYDYDNRAKGLKQNKPRGLGPHLTRQIRHTVRDAFLGLGFGEGLAVIAVSL